MPWKYEPLPYRVSTAEWLRRLASAPYAFSPYAFSLQGGGAQGQRYDILGAAPTTVINSINGMTSIASSGTTRFAGTDPFAAIEAEVTRRNPGPSPYNLPFSGGAVGYFGYELAYGLEHLGRPVDDSLDMPELQVGIYDWFITIDHGDRSACLVATPAISDLEFERIKARVATPVLPCKGWSLRSEITARMTQSQYGDAIARIKRYIENGDCYQVNFAQRFEADVEGDPLALFETISYAQSAPYGACLLTPHGSVLSFSPERFLKVQDGMVLTQPIKGTRPRGADTNSDTELAEELVGSEKDRAENLMIVDLLRNDLGRCCEPGSIEVDRLFELQSFESVHHLVSTIRGKLKRDTTPLSLLKASFPGGSITGAPKVRAMEIIRELEACRRGPYCGAIGYYGYDGTLDTNLGIRTMAWLKDRIYYWGGGGIVADSTTQSEYQESLDKVAFIPKVLLRPNQSILAAQNSR